MKNKITFIRFTKSKSSFDEALHLKDKKEKEELENKINVAEQKYKEVNQVYLKITKEEHTRLQAFNNFLNSKFQIPNFGKFSESLQNKILGYSKRKNAYSNQLLSVHSANIEKQNFIKDTIQEAYLKKELILFINNGQVILDRNNAKKSLNKLKEELNQFKKFHDRIEIEDINELNGIIEKMKNKGWNVKQIEGIQSGKYFLDRGSFEQGGAGYGFSFTEGVMVLWEKLD